MNKNIRKYLLSTVSALIYQVVAIICGLVLPRMLIQQYGSEVNGLVSSIQQFLGFIVLTEGGVGATVQASLYEPLVKGDFERINQIQGSACKFFNKFTLFIAVYTLILMMVYPLFIVSEVSHVYIVGLIFVLSLDSIITYLVGIFYQILLRADQRQYINNFISIVTVVIKTVAGIFIINSGFGILFLELALTLFSVLRTLFLVFYTRKNYDVGRSVLGDKKPIKQKWNGIAQHVSAFIEDNIDIIVLTLFSSLENVSVYSVYYMVKKAVSCVMGSVTSGYAPLWGNLYAQNDRQILNRSFCFFQWLTYMIVAILFTDMGILVLPFVRLYTRNIQDAAYVNLQFAVIFTIAYALISIQGIYKGIVLAAGNFRETQMGDIIETILNIFCSVVFVFRFGIVGVAMGTLIAVFYKVLYLVWYLSKNVICQSPFVSLKYVFINGLGVVAAIFLASMVKFGEDSFVGWTAYAFFVFVISCLCCVGINFIFYRAYIYALVRKIKRKR